MPAARLWHGGSGMDNRTIRRALMRRCPEVYFISRPKFMVKDGKRFIVWGMLAKIKNVPIPVQLVADMPDTALLSHKELLNTLVSEVYDAIRKVEKNPSDLPMAPGEFHPPLSAEGRRVFDNPEIQYFIKGDANVDPTGKRTDAQGNAKKGKLIIP